MRTETWDCFAPDCKASFTVDLQDDYGDDWTGELTDTLARAKAIKWQPVSVAGAVRFRCPLCTDPNAATR